MKKYLCREGMYPSGTYFIVEASSWEELESEFNAEYRAGKILCTIVREAFDDEWYEDEDGGLNYKGDGAFHKNSNLIWRDLEKY
jgi:hypothetical protein